MQKTKTPIAVLFPAFFNGGAEAVAFWMLETLKHEYDLTLVTFSTLALEEVNRLYGTNLKDGDFSVEIPYRGTPLPEILTGRYGLFTARQHLLLRYFKTIKDRFQLAIGVFNEMDFGKPGIQYFHSPMFGPGHEKARAILGYPDSSFRRFYHRFFEGVSGFSAEGMKSNLSVANSAWTARILRDIYGMNAGVLYPPVVLDAPDIPWSARENGFVCVSRIVAEKQIEKAVTIIRRVRANGLDVHLHIISGNSEPAYRDQIIALTASHKEWIFLHENISRTELAKIMAFHRYGIHVRDNEQFGISVAECIQAGCIPFVPANGGPEEIVGDLPEIKFTGTEDAVSKICRLVSGPGMERSILQRLAVRKNAFGIEPFRRNVETLVVKALSTFAGDSSGHPVM